MNVPPTLYTHRLEAERIVKDVLVDALAVDDDEVMPSSRIVVNLGAESIDYLDIHFKLEQKLSRRLPNPFNLIVDGRYNHARGQVNPTYTLEGMEEVREKLSHFYDTLDIVDKKRFEESRSIKDLERGINVEGLVRYVEAQLSSKK